MKNKFSRISTVFTIASFALFLLTGCKKNETTAPPATTLSSNNTVATNPYFMQGLFGGEAVNLQGTPEPFTSSFSNAAEVEHEDHDGENNPPLVTGTRWFNNSSTDLLGSTQGSVELRKVVIRVFIAPYPVAQQHYDMLNPGTQTFSDAQQQGNGAYVTFRDSHGVLWTSKGDQTGSTITITSRGEIVGASAAFAGKFSAKMYDGNGNVKQLTNVSFSGIAGL